MSRCLVELKRAACCILSSAVRILLIVKSFLFAGILLIQRDRTEILADRITPPPLGRVAVTDEVLEWRQLLQDVFTIRVAARFYPPVDLRVVGGRLLLLSPRSV